MTSKIDPTAFIHPLADVEDGATIGKNSQVWRWSHIMPDAIVGDNVMIGEGCHIASGVVIGDNCRVQNGCQLFEGVTLENSVFLAPNVIFTNVKFPRSHRKGKFEKTILRSNCSIGANSVILCGIEIGTWAMIGMGSVVTRSVAPGVTAFGCPAVAKKNKNHHLEKLNI